MDGFLFNWGIENCDKIGSNFKRKLKMNKFSYIKKYIGMTYVWPKKIISKDKDKRETEENICYLYIRKI